MSLDFLIHFTFPTQSLRDPGEKSMRDEITKLITIIKPEYFRKNLSI